MANTYKMQYSQSSSVHNDNMAHNAAVMETVKTLYPADYAAIVNICNEKGLNPEIEIPAYIDALQGGEREIILAAAEDLTLPKNSPGRETQNAASRQQSGFEKLAEYARRPA